MRKLQASPVLTSPPSAPHPHTLSPWHCLSAPYKTVFVSCLQHAILSCFQSTLTRTDTHLPHYTLASVLVWVSVCVCVSFDCCFVRGCVNYRKIARICIIYFVIKIELRLSHCYCFCSCFTTRALSIIASMCVCVWGYVWACAWVCVRVGIS